MPMQVRTNVFPIRLAPLAVLVAALFALSTAGCSNRQVYETLQGYQAQQCERTISADDRERCLAAASDSYDQYRQKREEDQAGGKR